MKLQLHCCLLAFVLLSFGGRVAAEDVDALPPSPLVSLCTELEQLQSIDSGQLTDECLRYGPRVYGQLTELVRSEGTNLEFTFSASVRRSLKQALKEVPGYVESRTKRAVAGGRRMHLEQQLALHILEHDGRASDVAQVMRYLAMGANAGTQAQGVRSSAQSTLVALLERDSRSFGLLEVLYRKSDEEVKPLLLNCVGRFTSQQSLGFLVRELQLTPSAKPTLLAQIGRMAESLGVLEESNAINHVLFELQAKDIAVRRAACLALGRMEDFEAIGDLIALLTDAEPAVVSSAHWALERIAGSRMEPDTRRWESWWSRESNWWQRDADKVLGTLRSGTPGEISAGLRDLASHRAFRHELSQEVLVVLNHEQTSLVAQGCAVLEALQSGRAISALEELISRNDPRTSPHARRALESIQS